MRIITCLREYISRRNNLKGLTRYKIIVTLEKPFTWTSIVRSMKLDTYSSEPHHERVEKCNTLCMATIVCMATTLFIYSNVLILLTSNLLLSLISLSLFLLLLCKKNILHAGVSLSYLKCDGERVRKTHFFRYIPKQTNYCWENRWKNKMFLEKTLISSSD